MNLLKPSSRKEIYLLAMITVIGVSIVYAVIDAIATYWQSIQISIDPQSLFNAYFGSIWNDFAFTAVTFGVLALYEHCINYFKNYDRANGYHDTQTARVLFIDGAVFVYAWFGLMALNIEGISSGGAIDLFTAISIISGLFYMFGGLLFINGDL